MGNHAAGQARGRRWLDDFIQAVAVLGNGLAGIATDPGPTAGR